MIAETDRLLIRELDSAKDAEFIFELLNSPKFIKFIGDRDVRSIERSAQFIENRYRKSYRDNGYGLYAVELKNTAAATQIGLCGFVKRDNLPCPDLGYAFLPDHEGKGYGFESAAAMMRFGRDTLGFTQVLAITTQDNEVSARLLDKLGFSFVSVTDSPEGETLNLYSYNYAEKE